MAVTAYKNISAAYSITGSGPAVVLLHGFLENRKMWEGIAERLINTNCVITIDLLGHGDTEPLGYVHSMEDNAALVRHVLSELKIQQAVIAGHSMGGYVALAFAEMNPEMCTGLMLINSTSKPDSEERKVNRDRAIAAVKQNYTAFVRMSVANLFSENNRERLEAEIELVRTDALKTPLQGIVASLEGMKARKDRTEVFEKLNVPKLLVLGKNDPVLPYGETSELKQYAELVTFPDGHMSHIENFTRLADALEDFLKKIRPSR